MVLLKLLVRTAAFQEHGKTLYGNIIAGENSYLSLTGQYESVCCGALSAVIMLGDLCYGSEACPVCSGGGHAVSEANCKTIPTFSWWISVGL